MAAQARLRVVHAAARRPPEEPARDRVAEAAAHGHVALEAAPAEHHRAGRPHAIAHPQHVVGGVLAVAVGAHHVLAGVRVPDPREARAERAALAEVPRVREHGRPERPRLRERVGGRGPAPVVNHDQPDPRAGRPDLAQQRGQARVRLVGRDQHDHVALTGT